MNSDDCDACSIPNLITTSEEGFTSKFLFPGALVEGLVFSCPSPRVEIKVISFSFTYTRRILMEFKGLPFREGKSGSPRLEWTQRSIVDRMPSILGFGIEFLKLTLRVFHGCFFFLYYWPRAITTEESKLCSR